MEWTPRPIETWTTLGGAVLAAGLAVAADSAGRLLLGLAAVLLAGIGGSDLLLRPRLRADTGGLAVRTFSTRATWPWSQIERVAVDERSRYGRTARTLEVDTGDTLVLLGRRSLGADPRDVAAAITSLRTGR